GGGGDGIVAASGACHRVGDVQLDAVLPGLRHRGQWWRLVGSLWNWGGGLPPILLSVLLSALLGAGAMPARTQEQHEANGGAVYRRPLGDNPKTLGPARISDIYTPAGSPRIFDRPGQFGQTLANTPALGGFWW